MVKPPQTPIMKSTRQSSWKTVLSGATGRVLTNAMAKEPAALMSLMPQGMAWLNHVSL
ncbi:hypothetical protein [Roseibium sp. M-1]